MNTFKRLSFPNVFTEAGMKKSFPFQGSLLRIPEIPRTAFILGAFFLLTTGFWFYLLQILHPPCCDARFYLELGSKLQSEGADTFKQQLRTFGYPWVLSATIGFAKILFLPVSLVIFLMQVALYFAAVVLMTNTALDRSKTLSTFIYLGLCANVFVIPYLGITLTDSVYTTISLVVIAGAMKLDSLISLQQPIDSKWVTWGVFVVSLAVVVRPAALWLYIPLAFSISRDHVQNSA